MWTSRETNCVEAPLGQSIERHFHNLKVDRLILAGSNPLLLSLLSLAHPASHSHVTRFYPIARYLQRPNRADVLARILSCRVVLFVSNPDPLLSRLSCLSRDSCQWTRPCVVKSSWCLIILDSLSYSTVKMHINMFLCICEDMRA